MSQLEVLVTSLHYPEIYDADPGSGGTLLFPAQLAVPLGRLRDFTDLEVDIPRNDKRTAQVSIPWDDDGLYEIFKTGFQPPGPAFRGGPILYPEPYATRLYITYNGTPIFWGEIVNPDYDDGDEKAGEPKVTLHATDTGRLEQMFLRLGDAALNSTPDKKPSEGSLTLDSTGIRLLRDSATTRPNDLWRGWPRIGIKDGLPSPDSPLLYPVKRGDNVWDAWKGITGHEAGPEFSLTPLALDNGDHYYFELDCFGTPRGRDLTDKVFFHRRYGLDNLDGFTWSPGGKYVNSSIVTSSDGVLRVAGGRDASLARTGAYMQWDATNYKAHSSAVKDVLAEKAKQVIGAYGTPPDFLTVTLKPDEAQPFQYLRDFDLGDIVTAGIRHGWIAKTIQGAINSVKVKQVDQTPRATVDLDIVPSVAIADVDLHVFP